MTLKKAIEILKYYQKWRRGEVDDMKYSPTEIGNAIDIIIDFLEDDSYG